MNKIKISAGIVLYNPDINRLKQNIKAVIPQVDVLVLYDNGSKNITKIEKMISSLNINIILLKSTKNTGVAHALNEIAKQVLNEKYDWLLTLDQDTVLKPELVINYLKYINLPNVGQLCCDFIDRNTNKREYNQFNSEKYKEIDKWITSGSLINLQALKKVGGFDEDLFIDYVDFDVCFALRKNGYKNYIINFVGMLHEIGERKTYSFFFKEIDVMNHSAFRHFYITRNEILVYKRYPNEKLPNMYFIQFKAIIKVILFENKKIPKILAINKGLWASKQVKPNNRKKFL